MDAKASADTPCFQTGETWYGKSIIERVITGSTPIADAKCVLVSFDSTMRNNLSIDIPFYAGCGFKNTESVARARSFTSIPLPETLNSLLVRS